MDCPRFLSDPLRVAVNGKPVTVESYRVTEPADGRVRTLEDLVTGRTFALSASGTEDWFAWNPGRANTPLCGTLGPDEWKGFFCVEPYSAKPYILQPGESKVISLTIEATGPRR